MAITIPVGDGPRGIDVNETTNTVYVANDGDNNVSVIDGDTNTVTDLIDVGSFPFDVAVNEVTNKIYVTNLFGSSVSVIDGDTNTVPTTITIDIGTQPRGITVNQTTNKIYVANFGTSSVSVINGDTDVVDTVITTGITSPSDVAVNETTNIIYVAPGAGTSLSVIDGTTDIVFDSVTVGSSAFGVAVNEITNKIYVTSIPDDSVTVIDGETNTVDTIITTGIGDEPAAVAVKETTNRIYVSDFVSTELPIINGFTNTVTDTVTVETNPAGIAINQTTNIVYVSNNGSNSVSVIVSTATFANEFQGLALGTINPKDCSVINSICGDASLKIGEVVKVLPKGTGNGFTQDEDLLPRVGITGIAEPSYGIVVGGDFEGVYGNDAISIDSSNLALGVIVSFFDDGVTVCTEGRCLALVAGQINIGDKLTSSPVGLINAGVAENIIATALQATTQDTGIIAVDVKREEEPILPIWFDTNFKRRVLITINSLQVPSTQTNFPFLFNSILTDLTPSNVQSGGEDIRFASESGLTEFNVEIEKMDTGATSLQAWAKIPSISNGTKFYMYYGNPTASLPPLIDRQAVWPSDYQAVYHLNQTTFGAATTIDSTSKDNDGTPQTSLTQVSGQIDGSLDFNGNANEFINIPDSATFDPGTGPWSVSVWIMINDTGSNKVVVAKQDVSPDFRGWAFRLQSPTKFRLVFRDSEVVPNIITVQSDDNISVGSYVNLVGTYDGNTGGAGVTLYKDGVAVNQTILFGDTLVSAVANNIVGMIAGDISGDARLIGELSEVRLSNIEKSADFILTEYNNQKITTAVTNTFYTVGTVETIP